MISNLFFNAKSSSQRSDLSKDQCLAQLDLSGSGREGIGGSG